MLKTLVKILKRKSKVTKIKLPKQEVIPFAIKVNEIGKEGFRWHI